MPKVIFNGEAGEAFTNESEKVLYQFVASLTNTCGTCLQYHMAISSYWPIPIHRNCSCVQRLLKPGQTAEPWVDYRQILDEMSPDQKREAIGASNYKLLKAGVVKWDDVVTNARVRSFREVVAREKLTLPELKALGVRDDVARAAWTSVHTTAHEAASIHRKALVDNLLKAGVSPQQIKNGFGRGMAAKVTLVKPHGPGGPGTAMPITPIEPLIPLLGLDAVKVRAAMKPKVKPTPKPQGKPVGDALTIDPRLPKATAENVLDAIKAIQSVHGTSGLNTIPVKPYEGDKNSFGEFWVGADGKAGRITIAADGEHQRMTAAHEIGHFIEYQAIPKAYKLKTGETVEVDQRADRFWEHDPIMAPWLAASRASEAYKRNTFVGSQDKLILKSSDGFDWAYKVDKTYAEYLNSPSENWARSYAQYIATRSGDPRMKADLDAARSSSVVFRKQWADDDFKPIADQIDKLLDKLGWRK